MRGAKALFPNSLPGKTIYRPLMLFDDVASNVHCPATGNWERGMCAMVRKICALLVVGLLSAGLASADLIDFEDLIEGAVVGTIVTATNSVTFTVDGGDDAFVHAFGLPRTAFAPSDLVADPGFRGGKLFAADESTENTSLEDKLPYELSFAQSIDMLSVDLYDFRGDGGNSDTIVLSAFTDANFTTLLGTVEIPIVGGLPDGSLHTGVIGGIGNFRSVKPATLLLLGFGMAVAAVRNRRRV